MEKFSHDNPYVFSTLFKSGSIISRTTIQKYPKTKDYFRFKARKKPFLSDKHKAARLKWAKEHQRWTFGDWLQVILMDEATFEMGLNKHSCCITKRKGKTMESQYLKLIFKSGRSTIGIGKAITLEIKALVHFLEKKNCMNSDIYINHVLEKL